MALQSIYQLIQLQKANVHNQVAMQKEKNKSSETPSTYTELRSSSETLKQENKESDVKVSINPPVYLIPCILEWRVRMCKEPHAGVAVFQNLLVSVFRLLGLHSTGMCLTSLFTLLMSPWGLMPPHLTLANLIPPQSLASEITRQQVQTHKLTCLTKSSSCPIYPALATMLKRNLGNKRKKKNIP